MTNGVRGQLTTAWRSLGGGRGGHREWRALRIKLTHPLAVFAAVREADRIHGVLFECPIACAPAWRLRFESEGLGLTDDRDVREGAQRIALSLERADLEEVFLVMAEDLIESSRTAPDIPAAITAIGARLAAWQTCLKLRKDGFTRESALGLYGELTILERLASTVGIARAVDVWTGPERGLHDFEAGTLAVEVKTSQGVAGPVRIGSLEQLDPSGLKQLALCRVVVVPDGSGRDLAALVKRTRAAASDAGPSARRALDQRLLMSGYIEPGPRDAPFESLSVLGIEAYDVSGTFPRVTREVVPAAVLSAEYRLDLGAASGSRLSKESFVELLTSFKEEAEWR